VARGGRGAINKTFPRSGPDFAGPVKMMFSQEEMSVKGFRLGPRDRNG